MLQTKKSVAKGGPPTKLSSSAHNYLPHVLMLASYTHLFYLSCYKTAFSKEKLICKILVTANVQRYKGCFIINAADLKSQNPRETM